MSGFRAFFAIAILVLAGACSVPGPGQAPDGIWDPNETANRKVHAFNTRIDEKLLRGTGGGYADKVPEDVQMVVTNVADAVSLPATVVNQLLQGRLVDASRNTLRFTINATLGFGGMFDPATEAGLPKDESDFGATLAVWGVPEGGYLVLPIVGPSTERDAVGRVVDLFTNPLDRVLTVPQRRTKTAFVLLDKVGSRGQYAATVDGVLYDSADSYAQLRLIYLQNRRFELGEEAPAADVIDPTEIDTTGF